VQNEKEIKFESFNKKKRKIILKNVAVKWPRKILNLGETAM